VESSRRENRKRHWKEKTLNPDSVKLIQVGDYVRFRALAADCKPTPLLVTLVLKNGMIRLLDKPGYYAAHLFVVVDPPERRTA
jgi:hypothetical protein